MTSTWSGMKLILWMSRKIGNRASAAHFYHYWTTFWQVVKKNKILKRVTSVYRLVVWFLPHIPSIMISFNISLYAHNSSQCPDAKLATRRRARPPSCRHQDSRYAGEEVFTWGNLNQSKNIWSLCLGLRNHNLENADDWFLKSSLMLQALLRRVDYNGPGSCNPVFLLYTFANTANTLRLAWPGMHHTISILWTPASCHYHNIASWVDQSQTGQARSLQAQSLATLLQGGTRQLLPTDGKIEDDHCFLTNIVLLIQQTLHLLHPIRPDEGWTF